MCEIFRRQPDALERTAALDATYGRNSDLEKMPMYGVVFSFEDPFDTRDMRTTGSGDARYDIEFRRALARLVPVFMPDPPLPASARQRLG